MPINSINSDFNSCAGYGDNNIIDVKRIGGRSDMQDTIAEEIESTVSKADTSLGTEGDPQKTLAIFKYLIPILSSVVITFFVTWFFCINKIYEENAVLKEKSSVSEDSIRELRKEIDVLKSRPSNSSEPFSSSADPNKTKENNIVTFSVRANPSEPPRATPQSSLIMQPANNSTVPRSFRSSGVVNTEFENVWLIKSRGVDQNWPQCPKIRVGDMGRWTTDVHEPNADQLYLKLIDISDDIQSKKLSSWCKRGAETGSFPPIALPQNARTLKEIAINF